MNHVLITGAGRGIGFELTRQLLARGERVFAGCRQPHQAKPLQELEITYGRQLTIVRLDVTDDATLLSARTAVAEETDHLDWLINNAGILVRGETLANFDPEVMKRTFDVNATGPLRVAARFVELLRQGTEPKLLNISSQLGSLHRAKAGGLYSYNASKAALNMLTRMLAHDLQPDGITVVPVHPGWVQTDMGGSHAAVTPADSAAGILRLADKLTPEDSNKFYTYSGEEHPW